MIKDYVVDLKFNDEGIAYRQSPKLNGLLKCVFLKFPEDEAYVSHHFMMAYDKLGVNIFNQQVVDRAHNVLFPRIQPCDGKGMKLTFGSVEWVLNDYLLIQLTGVPGTSVRLVVRYADG